VNFCYYINKLKLKYEEENMSSSPKTLKERLDCLEQNDLIFKKGKQAVMETIQEIRLKIKLSQTPKNLDIKKPQTLI